MKPIYEIIGPDNKVHYRRPEGHPDISIAKLTPGYLVRLEELTPEERNQRDIDFGRALLDDLRASEALKQCDNPKLLWLFAKAIEGWRAQQHCLGVNLNIIDQIENRLYPEYDGENVRMTDTGWITPDGPVDYL